jgi:hypothetical protein
MPLDDSTASVGPSESGDPMKQLSASAQGWHTTSTPRGIQVFAAILAVSALAVACLAILTVGRVAYPINAAIDQGDGAHEFVRAQRRLHAGIQLTVLAVILIVIAALSGWWPKT